MRPRRFLKGRQAHIRELLRREEIASKRIEDFLQELAVSVGRFDRLAALREASRPGATRKNLKAALSALFRYSYYLNRLDGNAWQLLDECNPRSQVVLRGHVQKAMAVLEQARQCAETYPKRGALADTPRLYLAADVAVALEGLLGCPLGKRRGAVTLYERVLSVVLEEATGRPVKNVADLGARARKGVKRVRVDGVVEYRPPFDWTV